MRCLSKKRQAVPSNQPIRFKNGRFRSKPSAIAKAFNFQYTNVRQHRASREARKLDRKMKAKHLINHDVAPFSTEDVANAIKAAKNSTALGPDGLSVIHLKHMGHVAVSYLTAIFNLSFSGADSPAIWKRVLVLPVVKPGKPAEEVSS